MISHIHISSQFLIIQFLSYPPFWWGIKNWPFEPTVCLVTPQGTRVIIDTSSPTGWSRPIPSQPRCWSTSGARVWTTWRMFGPLDRKEWLEELLRPNGKWWQVDVYKRHRLATYLCKTWLTRSYLVYPKNMFANDDLCRESLQNQLSSRWWNEL